MNILLSIFVGMLMGKVFAIDPFYGWICVSVWIGAFTLGVTVGIKTNK